MLKVITELVVAAILSVFGSTHELNKPSAISTFFAFVHLALSLLTTQVLHHHYLDVDFPGPL